MPTKFITLFVLKRNELCEIRQIMIDCENQLRNQLHKVEFYVTDEETCILHY